MSKRLAKNFMTNDEQFNLLTNRLDGILKLLALQTASGKKAGEAASLLERAGLDRKMIADVLNTSPDSVRALLSQKKKGSSEKKAKKTEPIKSDGTTNGTAADMEAQQA
jgi:hypothetical protein